MKISLNKANKLLEKLKGHLSGRVQGTIAYSGSSGTTTDKVINSIVSLSKTVLEQNIINHHVVVDFYKLKSAIFATNAEKGVSDILCKIEETKNLLASAERTVLELLTVGAYKLNEVTPEFVTSEKEVLASKERSPYLNFTVNLYDIEDIKRQVKQYKLMLNELEDKKMALNSLTNIEITFNDSTAELLGL